MKKQGKYSRRVFIAGVGCTPFRLYGQDEEFDSLTEGEYFGWAAIDAMDDAKVLAPEVQGFGYASATGEAASYYVSPAAYMARWAGLNSRHCYGHNEGCCSAYLGIMLGAEAIASGQFDVFLVGGQEFNQMKGVIGMPAYVHQPMTALETTQLLQTGDRAYTKWNDATVFTDQDCSQYRQETGISADDIDDTLLAMYKNCRYNAEGNELALKHDSLEAEAKSRGFDDVDVYLRSPLNPKITEYMRVHFSNISTHGAGAAVLVCEEEARKLMAKGVECVEILGCTNCMIESIEADLEMKATVRVVRDLEDITGMTAKDCDLLLNNDFVFPTNLEVAEITGYMEKGTSWKHFKNGDTRYDGPKPMQTNGGRAAFGHSYGVSGLADIYEAVQQIRGTAYHQMPNAPERVYLRGHGGMQNVAAIMLQKFEG